MMREDADFEMAVRLRQRGVSLGEIFSFISGLYFRGKLAYARTFCDAPPNTHGAFVITSSGGLVSPDAVITLERLQEISSGNLGPTDHRYRTLLERDAESLARICGKSCQIVLLGSIATHVRLRERPSFRQPFRRLRLPTMGDMFGYTSLIERRLKDKTLILILSNQQSVDGKR